MQLTKLNTFSGFDINHPHPHPPMRLRIHASPPESVSPLSTSPVLGDLDPLLQTSPQHEKYVDVIATTGTHHWLCHDSRRCDKRKRRSIWMWIGSVLLLLLLLGIYNVQSAWIAVVSDSEWKTFSNRYQHRYHRLPNPSLRSWLSYAKYHNCETSDYYETIEEQMRQLRACNSTLSMDEMIQKVASSSTRGYLVFRIENHKIILSQSHDIDSFPDFDGRPWWLAKAEHIYKLWAFKWLLHPTLRQLNSNITVVWNIMDEPAVVMASHGLCLPVFSAVDEKVNLGENQTHPTTTILPNLLLPYHLSIGFFGTIRQRLVNYWLPPKAWNDRKDTITWRGSTTGQWEKGPRFHLVNTETDGMNNPMVWQNISHDFAFVRVVQSKGQLLDEKYRVADPISYREMQDFKYVLDVDGNSFTERFPKLLQSGTLVFKATKYREWYSERVMPWIHYIPVKQDLSDLPDQVRWAMSHKDLAEAIVHQARTVVERHLRPQDQRCYAYRLLLEYETVFLQLKQQRPG